MKRNVNLSEFQNSHVSKLGTHRHTHTSHDMKQIIFLRYNKN